MTWALTRLTHRHANAFGRRSRPKLGRFAPSPPPNTIAWTHEGSTTNITAAFNGTLQTFTVTNGPAVFLSYAGANGSCSYRFTTNVTLHFSYQPKWLAGSNNVITNGVLSLTSYGGTNATQIEAAIGENQ